ncbi:MAG: hypothetical protein HYZ91_02780 [Candidatus Omnitrophica bacterium]|nr:hypothetical protein [Candidatus Omnitrophota bacterium]
MLTVLIFSYVSLVPIGWSPFPWGIQWADVVFGGLLIVLLMPGNAASMTVRRVDRLIALYLAASLVSLRATADVRQSSLELTKQVYLGLVYLVFRGIGRERAGALQVRSWCAWGATLLATLALLAWTQSALWGARSPLLYEPVSIPILGPVVRIKGPLMTPAFFCNYLTFALPLLLSVTVGSAHLLTKRWEGFAILLVALAAVFTMTYSLVGCLGAALFSLWHYWGATRARRFLRVILSLVFVAAFVGTNAMLVVAIRNVRLAVDRDAQVAPPPYYYAFQDQERGASRVTISVSYNPMGYYLLKVIAASAFRREPLTGIGLGNFHRETERAYHEGVIHATYRQMDPHAELLGRLAETGVLGGVTLVWLWWGFVRLGRSQGHESVSSISMNRALLAGLLGLLVNSVNTDIMNFRFLWVGMGLLRGLADQST